MNIEYMIEEEQQNTEILNPFGFVYITTNLVNGKRYIGQKQFDSERGNWRNYFGSGVALKNAIKKYGKENFKKNIVSFAFSQEELNKQEQFLINFLDAVNSDNYYNLSNGQYDSPWNSFSDEKKKEIIKKVKDNSFWNTATEEEKKLMKEKIKKCGELNPFFGKKHTDETKKKISNSNKGKTVGEKNASFWKGKKGSLHCNYGMKMSNESKLKMSISAKKRMETCGYITCTPIEIVYKNVKFVFQTTKSAYEFCCENNLILNTYHKKPPYKNMCFDSFRKKINSQFKFDLFEYSLLK